MVIVKLFPAAALALPAKVAVPFPLSVNFTPAGRAPFSVSCGAGTPLVVTVNFPAWPGLKVTEGAEVMAGAEATTMVNGAVAVPPALSCTVASGEYSPGTAGWPESTPVVALSVTPLGRPVAVQRYGAVPPVAARRAEYERPT